LLNTVVIADNQLFGQMTNRENQNIELGKISWYRDYDIAIAKSKDTNKPIFILFQEVPGCSTCQRYGKNILSHPILVDIIENEFIPLAIFNNKKGKDAKTLKHYVNILTQELQYNNQDMEEAYYSMYCFWTGEAKLGQLDGIIASSPGFMNGREVVKITYDPKKVKTSEIDKLAKKNKFSFVKNPSNFRKDKDEQYHLKRTDFKYLPLTPIQRTKINSAIADNENPDVFLSPTQTRWKLWLEENQHSKESLYTLDITKSWNQFKKNNF